MPLLEYRALLLDAPVEEEPEVVPAPAVGASRVVLPRPAPLPVSWVLIGGAHLRITAGGTVRIRRAPDIEELILLDII